MFNPIIIEDGKPEMEVLVKNTFTDTYRIKIKAKLNSVKESIEYIIGHPEAEFIFKDVPLSDGLSFTIFNQAGVNIPVIFITAYDHDARMAFENNSSTYLMNPINKANLDKVISKYKKLKPRFTHAISNAFVANPEISVNGRKKTRLLVTKGLENIAVRLEDIVLIYTQNKIVYVIDRSLKKYISDKTLSELEEKLDNTIFFRANRQYIVNIDYIRSFKPYKKVKLLIDITIPEITHSIVISQETAPAFRKWMLDA